MSMAMIVLFRGKLPDKRALSRVMAELGFPFTIPAGSLERQNGYMPMRLWREESGVEFDVVNRHDNVEEFDEFAKENGIDPIFDRGANFRWSSAEDEMLAAMCAAAALAKLVNGIVFEDQEGKLFSPDEAAAFAREHLKSYFKPRDTHWRLTRPADIRRYLRPLLRQREDLVLIGRMLVVRPVRHVLRGVFLDRTSDRDTFRVWAYLKPLWGSRPQDLGYLDSVHDRLWHVWQSHFAPLLFDVLQQEIFGRLGKITTLDEVSAALDAPGERHGACVILLALAGERERAEAYVREVESRLRPDSDCVKRWVEDQRRVLARDINEVCAELRAEEAKTVKALKLEKIWEPSPFPVELPAAERRARTAEPLFAVEPWIPRPPGLLLDVPEAPGDIRFAKDRLFRDGRPILVGALTREQAEERHRSQEDYVLAVRLVDGLLCLLRWEGTDRLEPRRASHPHPERATYAHGFHLELYGADCFADARFHKNYRAEGEPIELDWVPVRDRATRRCIWRCSLYGRKTAMSVEDNRHGETIRKEVSLSQAEASQLTFARPDFGEFENLVQIVLMVLRTAGYGEIT
ncbi:MAG TPA: hypothetical protein VK438_08415 [Xanthobacteraceae bacterium]|nr:hypothetical protein [Xanthobacteraceae bacterium]